MHRRNLLGDAAGVAKSSATSSGVDQVSRSQLPLPSVRNSAVPYDHIMQPLLLAYTSTFSHQGA